MEPERAVAADWIRSRDPKNPYRARVRVIGTPDQQTEARRRLGLLLARLLAEASPE